VPEFFGGANARDEGCAIADFLRLSLMLHRATGKGEYLDRAERCLLNHLYFNQFATGDFGHRTFFEGGIAPTESVGRAWWCCTMHGYRSYQHVLDSLVRVEGGTVHVDLYQDFDWSGEGLEIVARYRADSPMRSRLVVEVREAEGEAPLAFRRPAWADSVTVTLGGRPASIDEREGYLELRRLRPGDRIEVVFEHRAWIETRDGRRLALGAIEGRVEGLLFVGPWLYVVDDGTEPLFFGEPWKEANEVLLPAVLDGPEAPSAASPLVDPARHVAARYVHGGFPGEHPLTLRPIAEQTAGAPGTVATWIPYRRT
jgi:DUF1680 family protein